MKFKILFGSITQILIAPFYTYHFPILASKRTTWKKIWRISENHIDRIFFDLL